MSCECWNKRDTGLREKFKLKISDACSALELSKETLDLKGVYGLPLQQLDGKRPKRGQPKFLQITHCPFCGRPYDDRLTGEK